MASRRYILGIDPGQSGGIVLIDTVSGEVRAEKMPETFPDIHDFLMELRSSCGGSVTMKAYLENVGHGMPGQSSAATAKFARHNGHLEMALYSLGIPTEMVTPQKWMKFYSNSLGKSTGMEKKEWKNRLKGEAQRLFPNEKVTLCVADALLIANYGASQP